MKKTTSWKTFAGLALAAGTWLKLSGAKPAEPEEDKEDETPKDETPKEACIRWYGNLTWHQYQDKLLNLDIEYEKGRMDKAIYESRRYRLLYCRNQQKVPGF
jgi:hypothetical protein